MTGTAPAHCLAAAAVCLPVSVVAKSRTCEAELGAVMAPGKQEQYVCEGWNLVVVPVHALVQPASLQGLGLTFRVRFCLHARAGRVGSAFAAELGTMAVNEQTDSLHHFRV